MAIAVVVLLKGALNFEWGSPEVTAGTWRNSPPWGRAQISIVKLEIIGGIT